ncbi:hypothetical protein IWQ60_004447 [Tieghemiomyces parasiticus]|uniref:Uncharacterized protein n=1 Tax=Tieghemiomyces parasiticus TaxID=78921 RepID=A0A9W8A8V4_9FUNG|nr:hypothetical protein IWQ60_004447 [Tieghemiomyces parasiticus]
MASSKDPPSSAMGGPASPDVRLRATRVSVERIRAAAPLSSPVCGPTTTTFSSTSILPDTYSNDTATAQGTKRLRSVSTTESTWRHDPYQHQRFQYCHPRDAATLSPKGGGMISSARSTLTRPASFSITEGDETQPPAAKIMRPTRSNEVESTGAPSPLLPLTGHAPYSRSSFSAADYPSRPPSTLTGSADSDVGPGPRSLSLEPWHGPAGSLASSPSAYPTSDLSTRWRGSTTLPSRRRLEVPGPGLATTMGDAPHPPGHTTGWAEPAPESTGDTTDTDTELENLATARPLASYYRVRTPHRSVTSSRSSSRSQSYSRSRRPSYPSLSHRPTPTGDTTDSDEEVMRHPAVHFPAAPRHVTASPSQPFRAAPLHLGLPGRGDSLRPIGPAARNFSSPSALPSSHAGSPLRPGRLPHAPPALQAPSSQRSIGLPPVYPSGSAHESGDTTDSEPEVILAPLRSAVGAPAVSLIGPTDADSGDETDSLDEMTRQDGGRLLQTLRGVAVGPLAVTPPAHHRTKRAISSSYTRPTRSRTKRSVSGDAAGHNGTVGNSVAVSLAEYRAQHGGRSRRLMVNPVTEPRAPPIGLPAPYLASPTPFTRHRSKSCAKVQPYPLDGDEPSTRPRSLTADLITARAAESTDATATASPTDNSTEALETPRTKAMQGAASTTAGGLAANVSPQTNDLAQVLASLPASVKKAASASSSVVPMTEATVQRLHLFPEKDVIATTTMTATLHTVSPTKPTKSGSTTETDDDLQPLRVSLQGIHTPTVESSGSETESDPSPLQPLTLPGEWSPSAEMPAVALKSEPPVDGTEVPPLSHRRLDFPHLTAAGSSLTSVPPSPSGTALAEPAVPAPPEVTDAHSTSAKTPVSSGVRRSTRATTRSATRAHRNPSATGNTASASPAQDSTGLSYEKFFRRFETESTSQSSSPLKVLAKSRNPAATAGVVRSSPTGVTVKIEAPGTSNGHGDCGVVRGSAGSPASTLPVEMASLPATAEARTRPAPVSLPSK